VDFEEENYDENSKVEESFRRAHQQLPDLETLPVFKNKQ